MLVNSIKIFQLGLLTFKARFSFDNKIMLVFYSDKVKGCHIENSIVVKHFDASSKDNEYWVVKLWKYLCKLNPSTNIRCSLYFFVNIQRTYNNHCILGIKIIYKLFSHTIMSLYYI